MKVKKQFRKARAVSSEYTTQIHSASTLNCSADPGAKQNDRPREEAINRAASMLIASITPSQARRGPIPPNHGVQVIEIILESLTSSPWRA
jgi:hypothetical protein